MHQPSSKKLTTEEFIKRATETHGIRYDYTNAVYTGADNNITIICKLHGTFQQRAREHIRGHHCPKCGKIAMAQTQQSTTSSFIKKASVVHKNLYTYDYTDYKRSKQKVTITCPVHGNFQQTPSDHLAGKGCKQCAQEKSRVDSWSYTGWKVNGMLSNKFTGYTLYLIECSGGAEKFIKVGKTYTSIQYRFKNKQVLPYDYTILHQVSAEAAVISKLEADVAKLFKPHKYIPALKFGGYTECYTSASTDIILTYLKEHQINADSNPSNI